MVRQLTRFWYCLALAAGLVGVLPASRGQAITLRSTGSQVARPAGDISCSGAGGAWSATSTWSDGVLPTAADFVTIDDGCTVTIDTDSAIYALVVGQGASGVLQFEADNSSGFRFGPLGNLTIDGSTSQSTNPTAQLVTTGLVVKGDITIGPGTTFKPNGQSTVVSGNWTDNGVFTSGAGTVTFDGTDEQVIGGNQVCSQANGFPVRRCFSVTPPTSSLLTSRSTSRIRKCTRVRRRSRLTYGTITAEYGPR